MIENDVKQRGLFILTISATDGLVTIQNANLIVRVFFCSKTRRAVAGNRKTLCTESVSRVGRAQGEKTFSYSDHIFPPHEALLQTCKKKNSLSCTVIKNDMVHIVIIIIIPRAS